MTNKKLKPIEKPKQWKYKSGSKKGRLRPQARKYLSYQTKLYYQTGLTKKERIKKESAEPKEDKPRIKAPFGYYRSLIEVKFRSKEGISYGNSGITIWIYDTEPHSQQELIGKLLELDRKYGIGINTGVKNNKIIYNVEIENVSKYEIRDFGNFNFLISFPNGWSEDGRI